MSKGPEVIIIDDDRCTLELNKLTAKSVIPKAEVRGFLSARTALEYLRNTDTDDPDPVISQSIIVSDLHMPVIDGFGFLDEFSLLPSVVRDRYRVFVLSADANVADAERLTKQRILSGFFSKPLTVKKFEIILRQVGYL